MSNSYDIDHVIKRATEQGLRHQRTSSGHHQFYAPNGEDIIVASKTPSDHRAWDNFLAQMKRAGCVNGLGTLGDAMPKEVLQKPNGIGRLSSSQYVLEFIARHPEGSSSADICAYVNSMRPDLNPTSAHGALSNLLQRSKIIRLPSGKHVMPDIKAAQAEPKSQAVAVVQAVAGARTGDDAIDADLAALDEALSALARIESVVRKNRDVLAQLAKLKAALGMK